MARHLLLEHRLRLGHSAPGPAPQPACPSPASGILLALGHLTHRPQSESTRSLSRWTVSVTNLYVNLCEWGGKEGEKRPGWSVHSQAYPRFFNCARMGCPSLGRGPAAVPTPCWPMTPSSGGEALPWPSYSTLQSWGVQPEGGALRHSQAPWGQSMHVQVTAVPNHCSPGRCPEAAALKGNLCRKVSFLVVRTVLRTVHSLPPLLHRVPSEEAHPGPGPGGRVPGRFWSPWSCHGDRWMERAGQPQGAGPRFPQS